MVGVWARVSAEGQSWDYHICSEHCLLRLLASAMSVGRINSLVKQFEQVVVENNPAATPPPHHSVGRSYSRTVSVVPVSASSNGLPDETSTKGLHTPQSKLDEEILRHLQTTTKLDAAIQKQRATEKELTELRRQHEKLMQKLNRLSVVFNDFKGVIEDEPIKTVAPYRSSLSLPSTRKDGTSSSPSTSSQTAQLGTHRTAFSLDPGSHESIIGFADTTTSSSSSAPSPSSSSVQSQSSSTSSPKNPPVRPPRYTYNTHVQRASDINNANNLHTSSGINKTTDIHDHTIEVFLRAQKTYCNNLQLIVEVFLEPLRQEVLNSTDPFITQQDVQHIFSHIEVILGASQHLLETLQARVDAPERPLQIGDIFLQATEYFKLYTPYIANYWQAFALLNKCKVDSPRFLTFIRERERGLESKMKDLGSLLVLPVMRMSQYSNFLEEVLEASPEGMADAVPLAAALKKMKGVVEYVKEKTLDYESHTNVQRVQSMLSGKFQNLNAPHRRYIMEGVLQELNTNREYHCFLFNDILVIAKDKKGKLEHRSSIDLLYIQVQPLNDLESNLFCISAAPNAPNGNSQFHLLSSTVKDKLPDVTISPNIGARREGPIERENGVPSFAISPPSLSLPPTNSAPAHQLIFCASSRRDLDTWVTALNEAIEQEITIEKSKPKSSVPQLNQLKTSTAIGAGRIDFENNNVELHELIASGGSGCKIHRCTVEGYTCVAKILNIKEKHQEVVAPFVREIMIIEQLRHQNITKYLGHRFTKNSNRMWLFLEYIPFSLEKVIQKRKGVYFPPKEAVWIALEIAKGIEFLHSQNIIHRDIKCGNILCNLDENNEITSLKITDFDTSKILTSKGMQLYTCIGTTAFMAPEVLDVQHEASEGYSLKVDIYSFGMLLTELISLQPPFAEYDSIRVPELVLTGQRPTLPTDLPPEMAPIVRFIHHCTEFNPSSRPTSSNMVSTLTRMLKELTKGDPSSSSSPSPVPSAPHPLTKLVKDYFSLLSPLSSSPK